MEKEMSKDSTKKKNENTGENSSPIVNVEWQPPSWTDQFQKFIVDLQGAINDKHHKN